MNRASYHGLVQLLGPWTHILLRALFAKCFLGPTFPCRSRVCGANNMATAVLYSTIL